MFKIIDDLRSENTKLRTVLEALVRAVDRGYLGELSIEMSTAMAEAKAALTNEQERK